MLTLANLDELATRNEPAATSAALRSYLETLTDIECRNLVALAEMKAAAELVEMSKAAPDEEKAVFTRVAAIIRQATDSLGEIKKFAEEADVKRILLQLAEAAETQSSEPLAPPVAPPRVGIQLAERYTELYELPVFSLAGDREVYDAVSKMQRGREIKRTVTGGWMVQGGKPADTGHYDEAVVARMIERHLLAPALGGKPGEEPKAYNLTAIAWRCAGCVYTDKAAEIEKQVYSVLGTERDNPTAARWRAVLADWRARQARKDVTPGWNRFGEFTVALGDKVTGKGTETVTVIFDRGEGNGPDSFEFYGKCLNESAYLQVSRSKASHGKTVSQIAYDIAAEAAAGFAKATREHERVTAVRAKAQKAIKPPAPPLTVLDEGDDAEALAASLGIL